MREWFFGLAFAASALLGCSGGDERGESAAGEEVPGELGGEIVTPPFPVRGDAEGLVLTWFDDRGAHTASTRHEIPEARRGEVRVDSLELPPDARDPEHVWIADLREPGEGGRYVVRRTTRAAFDRRVETFGDTPEAPGAAEAVASAEVVVFGASWCGACRDTEAFLRERGIPFVERDVEREPGAREDMMRRAQRAGVSPRGIPVIDFRGRIIQGFDRAALERAIRETSAPAAGGAGGVSI